MTEIPTCPKCSKQGELVDSKIVYGKSYGHIWYCDCEPEGVYVGINKKTGKPLGTMADKKLRVLRKRAHAAFDPLWKCDKPKMSRTEAYGWLSSAMNVELEFCHIGMFDIEQCEIVERLARYKRNILDVKRPRR